MQQLFIQTKVQYSARENTNSADDVNKFVVTALELVQTLWALLFLKMPYPHMRCWRAMHIKRGSLKEPIQHRFPTSTLGYFTGHNTIGRFHYFPKCSRSILLLLLIFRTTCSEHYSFVFWRHYSPKVFWYETYNFSPKTKDSKL